jgi:hypothetical protein
LESWEIPVATKHNPEIFNTKSSKISQESKLPRIEKRLLAYLFFDSQKEKTTATLQL